MSFLNPVNEPVLRFSSTDAGAPQINYNSRVAGDVKAVLKACLVTGYGTTASAGWSIINEANHVAEFVSPSAAMSDYRFGIDDTSTSSTTWYYQYKNVRTNPNYNSPTKNFNQVSLTSPSNCWHLLVTKKGMVFIEALQSTPLSKLSSRMTYLGQVKAAVDVAGVNMSFFNVGHKAEFTTPATFFYVPAQTHINLAGRSASCNYFGALVSSSQGANYDTAFGVSTVDVASPLYIMDTGRVFVGQQPALLSVQKNKQSDLYGIFDTSRDGRPVMEITLGSSYADADIMYRRGCVVQLYLDYWGY